MEKIKRNGMQVLLVLVVVLLATVVGIVAVKKLVPSRKVMDLKEYYKVEPDEIMVILQNEIKEERGLYLDKVAYLRYDTVTDYLNKRFYWDANENLLIYTTQSDVVKVEIGSNNYYVNKSKSKVSYQIVKTIGNQVYIALDFIKLFSNIEYQVYEEPNRVVIQYDWENEYLYSTVKKATQLRYKPSIKSDILYQLKKGGKLVYIDTEELNEQKFKKVMTVDGVVGYVKGKHLTDGKYEKLENENMQPEYAHITKDYTISMGWHQVTNSTANDNLLSVLDQSKGINTISPTWFSIANNEGAITSLASERYVQRAHNAGIEVWALCDDFNPEIDMVELLSHTSRREKLENELIANAIKFGLDGINIDFENITAKSAPHYLQFLRELSIKCRNNGIVLSVDNYIPAPYNSFYDIEEQGKIVDYVVIMAYDEHHASSEESGSVSSIGFFKEAIENTLQSASKERVIIGLPFYTRLWTESNDGNLRTEAYAMSRIQSVLEDNGVKSKWDEATGQNYAEFKTEDGLNKVWLEDEKSIELRMKAASDADVAGMAYWKLGMEKESIWKVIQKFVN